MTLTQVTTGGVDENINIDSNTLKVDGTNNRVGIGTAVPSSPLHVSSSEDRLLLLQSSDHNAYLAFQETDSSSSTANRVGSVSDGLYFNTAGAERLRIDSSGRVLIGLSSGGTSPLNIEGAEGTAQLRIGNTNAAASDGDFVAGIDFHIKDNNDATGATCTSIRSIADQNHTATAKGTALTFHTTADDTTTLSERMRIDNTGRVGIGTTTVQHSVLAIAETTNGPTIEMRPNNSSVSEIHATHRGAGSNVPLNLRGSEIRFGCVGLGTTEAARISDTGNFGIGTTNPLGDLTVSNGGASGIELQPEITTNTNRITNYNRSTNSYNNFRLDGAQLEFLISGSTKFIIDGGNTTHFGVQQHSARGATTGTGSFTRDFTLGSTQSALIIAGFNHYGLFSHGCTKIAFAATGASFSTDLVHSKNTGNGGSWTISKPNNTTLRVTKNAGSYNGSGHWFIHVIAS